MSRYYRSILNVQGGAIDPDAQAFLMAAGIVDATITSAINNLVVGLKGASLWTKMKAIYPFVGGTATTHKFNLKDPRDLDVAFRLTFFGGITHSANGVQGNGTNGYANTHFLPSINGISASWSHSIYTNSALSNANYVEIGCFDGTNSISIYSRFTDTNGYFEAFSTSNRIVISNQTEIGNLLVSRIASNDLRAYANGAQIGSTITGASGSLPSIELNIMRYNRASGDLRYSARPLQFTHIGEGLTDTEAANFNTAIQALQTTLSRNV